MTKQQQPPRFVIYLDHAAIQAIAALAKRVGLSSSAWGRMAIVEKLTRETDALIEKGNKK